VRTNAIAKGLEWDDRMSKVGFWVITSGVILFSIPTLVIGFEQARVAHDLGYWAARQRETLEPMRGWMWSRVVPDGLMILGALVVFLDLLKKSYFLKKAA